MKSQYLLKIDKDLRQALKVRAAQEEKHMNEIIEQLIREYLDAPKAVQWRSISDYEEF